MMWWEGLLIGIAGVWAGAINTVVGSGTLVTFPVLVALGYPPVTATTSNAVGLITGTITGAYGYRRELAGQGRRVARLAVASFFGAIGGTALLLSLPKDAFEVIVPVLVGMSVLLVALQPLATRRLRERKAAKAVAAGTGPEPAPAATGAVSAGPGAAAPADAGAAPAGPGAAPFTPLLYVLIFLIGVYGGYFTAAQGIMLVGVMGLLLADPLQRINAFKNVLSAVVNLVAGIIYAVVAPVDWAVIAILAVSSILGGFLGARIGRRLSPTVLRATVLVIGVAAVVRLVV
ncbi:MULTISPECIES: sulfite exporter TauE/SafE family protein [Streptomyces]|uniref:Probable membrane transporter protein n=2 Tax=Streptomyces TaxID=1883 RepID=A0ABU2R2Z3_9ACTN|nr:MULTISPECIES: sulfite exporter TauE/SafE family protein [unclassified Streptomyces]MDT0411071.1 sulfite exporter TauE/SafE family protein [Streptomyces sp. DSM 41979]MYQ58099.1 TSUP family transporter [Streptomyces sp. SID4926]WEH28680.1 sulfite exporter TauE/SafE family protein [Streptomyces sp. AM 3-1-1]